MGYQGCNSMKPHDWQLEAVETLVKNKRTLVQAPPGAGKSFVGKLAMKRVDKNGKDTMLITPSKDLAKQWEEQWETEALTIQSIIKMPEEKTFKTKLLILDEAHRYESEVWSQVYDRVETEYMLGLSATPGDSYHRFDAVYTLPWEDTPLPRFTFIYHRFDMDNFDWKKYDEYTKSLRNLMKRGRPSDPQKLKKLELKRRTVAMMRRRVCHNSRNRLYTAIEVISSTEGSRNLIVSQTIQQAELIAQALKCPAYHSKGRKKEQEKALDDFLSGRLTTISSVNMLKEGFNCPEIDRLYVVSSALTEKHYVQLIGRALRVFGNKNVEIHVLIAKSTSDTNLIGLGESITGISDAKKIDEWKYNRGGKWSVDTKGGIFRKDKDGHRAYYDVRPEDLGRRLLKVKRTGGMFKVHDGEVLVKPGRGKPPVNLGPMLKHTPKPRMSLSSQTKLTFEELFNNTKEKKVNR